MKPSPSSRVHICATEYRQLIMYQNIIRLIQIVNVYSKLVSYPKLLTLAIFNPAKISLGQKSLGNIDLGWKLCV